MKNRLIALLLAVSMVICMWPATAVAAKKVSISKKVIVLNQGKTYKLKVKNAGGKKVKWSTNKTAVATVTSKGVVKGITLGGAKIKAKVGKKTVSCRVVVTSVAEKKITQSYGIIPSSLWSSPTKYITSKEFCSAITNIVKKYDPGKVDAWKKVASKALKSKNKVAADEAVLAMYEAAMVMGIDCNKGSVSGRADADWQTECETVYGFKGDWWADRTKEYLFSNAYEDKETTWGDMQSVANNSIWYFERHTSLKDNSYAFYPTDDYHADFSTKLTRAEAIHALRVFAECDALIMNHDAKYISPENVGTYDPTIITSDLLSKSSNLPEVTQSKLPSEWKGMGLTHRQDAVHTFLPICESDIKMLHDNGFNFTRYFLDFTKLRYPYTYSDKTTINELELKRLDQTLAWCIKYDVHLCINCMGFGGYQSQGSYEVSDIPLSEWGSYKADWIAIARRYKDIPSKYLSFDLLNEFMPDLQHADPYVELFSDTAQKIWAESPQRVVVKSFGTWTWLPLVEKLASKGIAIDIHPYMPRYLTEHSDFNTKTPVPEKWPVSYFRSEMHSGEKATIDGDIGGATIKLYIYSCHNISVLDIYADGEKISTIKPVSKETDGSVEYINFEEPYSITVPESAKTVEIHMTNGTRLQLEMIQLEKEGKTYSVVAANRDSAYEGFTEPIKLTFNGTGLVNSDGQVLDAEFVYKYGIKPNRDIAEKYGVGFVICEFGIFGFHDLGEVTYQYIDDMISMFERHGLGWCYCEGEFQGPTRTTERFTQKSSMVDVLKYKDFGGYEIRYNYLKEFLETIHKHTM